MANPPPIALSIAGSDPSGGAGIQADLKTFHQFGVYGEAAITLLTVQNTLSVSRVEILDAELVAQQIQAVLEDVPPQAVKTGALGNAAVIEAVASFSLPNLVVDPVMISKHGAPLIAAGARGTLRRQLLPKALLVTPNLQEAAALTGSEDPREAARQLADEGAAGVLVKGGHAAGEESVDLLWWRGEFFEFRAARINTPHTHGTGCSYSAAITALLAGGKSLPEAVGIAKSWITRAIATNPGIGAGHGPVNHFAEAIVRPLGPSGQ
jgi:hydroxymethylpyrimidine/phosphomethylpyrimidine kinase